MPINTTPTAETEPTNPMAEPGPEARRSFMKSIGVGSITGGLLLGVAGGICGYRAASMAYPTLLRQVWQASLPISVAVALITAGVVLFAIARDLLRQRKNPLTEVQVPDLITGAISMMLLAMVAAIAALVITSCLMWVAAWPASRVLPIVKTPLQGLTSIGLSAACLGLLVGGAIAVYARVRHWKR